jgi:hypothetical protein
MDKDFIHEITAQVIHSQITDQGVHHYPLFSWYVVL